MPVHLREGVVERENGILAEVMQRGRSHEQTDSKATTLVPAQQQARSSCPRGAALHTELPHAPRGTCGPSIQRLSPSSSEMRVSAY